jgi:cytosine/creatinine deaminase
MAKKSRTRRRDATTSIAKRLTEITNARLRGRRGLFDLTFDDIGHIRTIRAAGRARRSAGGFDAKGGLVLPAFVDPHLHLDLAYSVELVKPNKSGTLLEAIRLWDEAKRRLSADNVRERAIRAINAEVSFGTGFIRTHVDVGTGAGLRLTEGVLAARDACRHLCDIQIAVFPQDGILRDPGALEQMRAAIEMGCDVVGGIAHNERTDQDSRRHIDLLFELAREFNRDIDCHIDETDDPDSRCTEYLAAQTIHHGWQGRVTASHVCALSSYDNAHARKVINLLREARVHVVTNPPVNLHLQGRYDRYPKRRGLTRVTELLAAGVNVAAGQDCIADPFYPLGTGQMLDVAHMLFHADHLSTPPQMEQALDTVTENAARALRLSSYGIRAGARGCVVALPCEDVHTALRTRPRPIAVIRDGRLLFR